MRATRAMALAVVYYAAAKLGQHFTSAGQPISLIWPASGVGVAGVVLGGPAYAVAVLIGSLAAGWGSPLPVLLVSAGMSTGEALAAWALLRRLRDFRSSLPRLQDVLAFMFCASALAPIVAGGAAVAVLAMVGALPSGGLVRAGLQYWIGDAMGILLVGGFALSWATDDGSRPRGAKLAELAVVTALLIAVSAATFSGLLPSDILFLPLLAWAAFRFDMRGATLATLAVAAMAVMLTAQGSGPYGQGPLVERLAQLLMLLIVVTGTTLVLAALLSERRAAAAAERDANHRYQALIDASPLAIITTDPAGVVQSWNPAAERIFGFRADEAIGRQPPIIPAQMQQDFEEFRSRTMAGESIRGRETARQRRDGKLLDVSLSTAPLRDGEGRSVAILALLDDITARKDAERALRESESQLSAVLEAMTDLVFVIDVEGTYSKVVPKPGGHFYQPPADLVGRRMHDILPRDEADAILAAIHRALRERSAQHQEYSLDIDGRTYWFSGTASPISDREVVWVARDITERKRLEAQLIHSQRMEAVGQLAGGVAHDFNNILTTVLAMSELILIELPPDDVHRADVESIREAARRAALLTRQLLAFSRKQLVEPRPIDLNEVVLAVAGTLGRIIGKDIEIVTDLGGDVPTVLADPVQVEQLLLNLAVNARDAMPRGGRLDLATRPASLDAAALAEWPAARPGQFVRLTVRDTGHGIDPAALPHIFEPFFTTRDVGRGSGLGLATVYGIVQQGGGCITVESSPGHGARFDVYWPVAAGSGTDGLTPPVAVPNLQSAARGIGNR